MGQRMNEGSEEVEAEVRRERKKMEERRVTKQ